MDALEIYLRRISAKEILIGLKGDEFIFPFANGSTKLSGRDCDFREPTSRQEDTARSEGLRGEIQGETEARQPADMRDDAKASVDFWSIQGDFICHHQNEPRVQLCAKTRNIPNSTEKILM